VSAKFPIGYIWGEYDILHVEHIDLIRQAKARCDYLFVGVFTDELIAEHGQAPDNPLLERLQIVRAMRSVDSAVGQATDDLSAVWRQLQFDVAFLTDGDPAAIRAQLPDSVEVVSLSEQTATSSVLKTRKRPPRRT
jgi:glycerol-3-phosphate cytidylyltransferase